MPVVSRAGGLVILLLSAAMAVAQTPPPITGDAETVYSEAEQERDRGIAGETVQAVLAPVYGVEDQYARWKYPVCLNVYGLVPASKYVIERRIREIGQQVGAPMDRRDPCVPNVTIIFTPDVKATLDSIDKAGRNKWLPDYGFMRNRLKESLPVQAWYAVSIAGADGRRQLMNDGFNDGIQPEPFRFMSGEMNRLNSGVSTAIESVVIAVDIKAIIGRTLGTLADHVALLALAQGRDTSHCKTVPSIANLMFRDCDAAWRADAITANDIAMLTALYQTPDNALQRLQRQRIIGAMRQNLEKQPPR